MTWTVTGKSISGTATSTSIMQRLTGVWLRWTYGAPETTWISSDTSFVSITEDTTHAITIDLPLIWESSSYAWQGWLQRWTFRMARYAPQTPYDVLDAFTGNAEYGGTISSVKGFGPFRFTYRESYISSTSTDMVRR